MANISTEMIKCRRLLLIAIISTMLVVYPFSTVTINSTQSNDASNCIYMFGQAEMNIPKTTDPSSWSMFHHDAAHTGYSTSSAPTTNNLLWSYQTAGPVYSSPAIADRKVFFGSNDGKIYCLNADNGELVWEYTTGGAVKSSPAVSEGMVFIGSDDKKLYCLSVENGSLLWSFQTTGAIHSSPTVANGKVFFASYQEG
ncbi:MAG: PQQ-binding-like beta-propeller repeat protein, partial [Candidatus Thermoplasmatota archaeon]